MESDDIRCDDLFALPSHLDLFSGIGGFALAAAWAGLRTIGFAETDKYANKVLSKHWPEVPNFGDVRNVSAAKISEPIFVLTGGFPCQPFSLAGKRGGAADYRYLWPEMRRCISELQPAWVLAENVPGLAGMELDNVLADLAGAGYEREVLSIPACGVDARHKRQRLWIVAHATRNLRRALRDALPDAPDGTSSDVANNPGGGRRTRRTGRPDSGGARATEQALPDVADAHRQSARRAAKPRQEYSQWATEPDVGRVAHGIPARVDRLRGLGNAIVPQIAEKLMRWMVQSSSANEHIDET